MSIVTATAITTGVQARLNAARDTEVLPSDFSGTDQSISRGDGAAPTGASPGRVSSAEPVFRPIGAPEAAPRLSAADGFTTSQDSRYVRFVEAVQALRIDYDMTTLTDDRVAEIMASAQDIFMFGDGLPKEVRPLPADSTSVVEIPEVKLPTPPEEKAAASQAPTVAGVEPPVEAPELRVPGQAAEGNAPANATGAEARGDGRGDTRTPPDGTPVAHRERGARAESTQPTTGSTTASTKGTTGAPAEPKGRPDTPPRGTEGASGPSAEAAPQRAAPERPLAPTEPA